MIVEDREAGRDSDIRGSQCDQASGALGQKEEIDCVSAGFILLSKNNALSLISLRR